MEKEEQTKEYPKVNLDEIYDYIKRFSLSDSLFIIGTVNSVFKYGVHKLHKDDTIPDGTFRWVSENCPEKINRISLMLSLTRLARFLLLSKSNDYKKEVPDTGSEQLAKALHMVENLYDENVEPKKIRDEKEMQEIFSRIIQWQFPLQELKGNLTARAHLLFRKIPNEISCDYDIEENMLSILGMGVFEFMVVGHSLSTVSSGVLKHNLTIEGLDHLKELVTREKIDKFIEISSGTPEDYKKMVRGKDDWKDAEPFLDIYSLDPLIKIPIIKTETGNHIEKGCYVVPQITYLWQRMSTGIFYILSEYEKELVEKVGKSGSNPFRDSFGDIYKHYVGLQLGQGSKEELIDLDTIDYFDKKPDYALVSENSIILFEVKIGILGAQTKSLSKSDDIKNELSREGGNFSKAFNQLNKFEKAIKEEKVKDERFDSNKNIVKVVVTYEDFYLANGYLLNVVENNLGLDNTDNLQFMSVMDIDTCGTCLANGGVVANSFVKKISDKLKRTFSADVFLREENKKISNKNPLLDNAFNEFFSEMSGKDISDIDVEG